MLQDTGLPIFPTRRNRRSYTPEFKAEVVAACRQPGVSIASLAGRHGMNTNVVHRWLREFERAGDHRMVADTTTSAEPVAVQLAAFVPLELPSSMPRASAAPEQAIKVEIQKGR